MDDAVSTFDSEEPAPAKVVEPIPIVQVPALSAEQFRECFGENLQTALDLDRWHLGADLTREYARIEAEVREAVRHESDYQRRIRQEVFPRLAWAGANPPPGAGVHETTTDEIREIHRTLLFRGGVEACDGTCQSHDTLPMTIHQLGVALVNYTGSSGTWHQRLYRRDLRVSNGDPIHDVLDLLERRGRRGGLNHPGTGEQFSELFQRALMSYAERAILVRHSNAVWKMGHGNPAPLELLTGAGMVELMAAATRVIRELVCVHQKFVFVASEPAERMLSTIGQALQPQEFAIVMTLSERLENWLRSCHMAPTAELDWDGEKLSPSRYLRRFAEEVGSKVVVGVLRATPLAPPQIFYAHVDHADLAARIAIADSVLDQTRGFPMLIDLADRTCKAVYAGSLRQMADAAYAAAGVPFRYSSERQTRI